jgi:hypothetical protein
LGASQRYHVFTHEKAHAALFCFCYTKESNKKFRNSLQPCANGRRKPASVRGFAGFVARTAGYTKWIEIAGWFNTVAVTSVFPLFASKRFCWGCE